jgi:hypothetical protein
LSEIDRESSASIPLLLAPGLFSNGAKSDDVENLEKVDRPPVERFETAQEDLNTLARAPEEACSVQIVD